MGRTGCGAASTAASAKAALDAGRRHAHDWSDQGRGMAEEARQSIARLIDEQPILMQLGAPLRRGGRRAAANAVRQEFAGAEIGARLNVIADTVIQNVTGNATGSE